jgi:hypothetical protein
MIRVHEMGTEKFPSPGVSRPPRLCRYFDHEMQPHLTQEIPMPTRSPYPDAGEDIGEGADREPITRTSRWQKVVGIIGLVVLLLVGSRMIGAGGNHRPGQDTGVENQEQRVDSEDGGHVPPPWVPKH